MKYGFVIDNRRCIGCHACTVACKAEHQVPVGVNRTWVKYVEKGRFPQVRRFFSVMRCNHCEEAPCVDICPVSALFTREDGIVDFDSRRCIGCKSCMQACPYDALYIDPESHTAGKCNYCAHRIDRGLEPSCVNVCPTEAIVSGDIDSGSSKISRLLSRQQVQVRKAEKNTLPKVFYIDGDRASLESTEAAPEKDYIWSEQTRGVGHFSPKNKPSHQEPAKPVGKEKGHSIGDHSQPRRVYDPPQKGILWGWEVWAYLLTKSIAAGVFLVPFSLYYLGRVWPTSEVQLFSVLTALLFLAITNVLLVMDLDRPDRFLYVLLRPQWSSWLVRGAYIMIFYGACLALWTANYFLNIAGWLGKITSALGLPGALLTAVYTAFLFAQAKGRDLWQSALAPLHLVIHAFVAGASVHLLTLVFTHLHPYLEMSQTILKLGLVLSAGVIFLELLTPHGTRDSQKACHMILKGKYRWEFWGGVVLFGHLAPFIFLSAGLLWPASLLSLVGIGWFSRLWVKAPQEIPLS